MRIVRMPFGVGVIAETPWAAFEAKNALKVTWDRRARAFGTTATERSRSILRRRATSAAQASPGHRGRRAQRDAEGGENLRERVRLRLQLPRADGAAQFRRFGLAAATPAKSGAAPSRRRWRSRRSPRRSASRWKKVKLNLTLLGGGFGRRGHRDEEFVVDSVLLSKEVKRQ